MKKIIYVAIMVLTSACSIDMSRTVAGAGKTAKGVPLAAQITTPSTGYVYTARITNIGRWICEGTFRTPSVSMVKPTTTVTVPLVCSDGKKGTLILSGDGLHLRMVGTFRLSNGESGQVYFGNIR